MAQESILGNILYTTQRASHKQEHPVLVFDLDGTLFDNSHRSIQILRQFAQVKADKRIEQAIDGLMHQPVPYLVEDMLELAGIQDETLVREAKDYWMKRFFTDGFQMYDKPLRGAIRFVKKAFQLGGQIVYLSGRDAPGMLVGCANILRTHGFPIGEPGTFLMLKPEFRMSDSVFKSDAVRHVSRLGKVIAAFDNEPFNCNLFRRTWPHADSVWVKTTWGPHAPQVEKGCLTVPHF